MLSRVLGVVVGALVALVAAVPAHAAPRWTLYDRPAEFEVVEETDLPITTHDGTVLVADVLRPAAPGRYPVLVTQTPYGKSSVGASFLGEMAEYLVRRGYVQVIVDVRGTGGSSGQWDSFGPNEQRDGYDIVEWAAAQPWSDGKVGLNGMSYMGFTQLYTAALHPPHLKAIFPVVPMADGYRDITFSGGATNVSFIPLWLGLVTAAGITPPPYATSGDPDDLVRGLGALASHLTGAVNFQANTVLGATTGGDTAFDGPFWRTRSPLEIVDEIDVPTFVVGGLHDLFQRGTPLIYERLKKRVPARLVMGPWMHITAGEGLPSGDIPSIDQMQLRWFDRWLKGLDTRVGRIPRVTQYALGAERWETQGDWPSRRTRPRTLYLRGDGKLAREAPAASEAPQSYTQQPLSGICTLSTAQWTAGLGDPIPCTGDDNRMDESFGQAVYTTAPLERDLRISGPITANLWITTTAADAPLTVRVTHVTPDGASRELTAGWLAASLRAVDARRSRKVRGKLLQPWHPFTRESVLPVKAGEPIEMAVEVFPTHAVIPKGHRLRVVVAPSDFPHQAPPLPQFADSLGGRVRVLTEPDRASSVTLAGIGRRCARKRCRALEVPRLVRR